ncbi:MULTISPECIES: hypothetical protein [Vibrio]|nr:MULTISPECIES: hypothetical protein [Vibrio]MCG6242626.1 hypothetical protein [Vibrio diabolicus]MCG9621279.1 hypothetical protein [Vibrio diabolicus]MCR9489030.1 hypothetical protein [Vibrio alginolyticus]MCR9537681.1 hypothetical protein [Vibrio alginolyticus]MCR9793503.1 hypothetical protein [Vibrio parahaemolyticus]
MELEIINFLKPHLNNMEGYITRKPEGVSIPFFVIDLSVSRGESLYGNNGKPLGYDYDLRINVVDTRYMSIRSLRDTLIQVLDGFTGNIGGVDIIDCQLTDSTLGMNLDKSYEGVLFFTIKTK